MGKGRGGWEREGEDEKGKGRIGKGGWEREGEDGKGKGRMGKGRGG